MSADPAQFWDSVVTAKEVILAGATLAIAGVLIGYYIGHLSFEAKSGATVTTYIKELLERITAADVEKGAVNQELTRARETFTLGWAGGPPVLAALIGLAVFLYSLSFFINWWRLLGRG